jgi:hypothetical protein
MPDVPKGFNSYAEIIQNILATDDEEDYPADHPIWILE